MPSGRWTPWPSSWPTGSGRRDMSLVIRGVGVSPGRGRRAGAGCAARLSQCSRPRRADRTGRRRGGAAPRGGRRRGSEPPGARPPGAGARRTRGVADLRCSDPHGAGRGFSPLGGAAHPEQPAERRDRVRVQGARAPEPVVGVGQRAAPRAPRRPARHPDADAAPADGHRRPTSSGRSSRTSR